MLHAVLFVSSEPISKIHLETTLDASEDEVDAALHHLQDILQTSSPLQLHESNGKVLLSTRPEFGDYIEKAVNRKMETKLSEQALQTLAIIAYKQPITKAEIDGMRGVDSEKTLETLLQRRLIKVLGKIDAQGQPLLYKTTDEFLFRFNLKSLSDLPGIERIRELYT